MSSKPSKPKATPEEKAMREEASRMWTDVKERFWPIDEKLTQRSMDVSRGRVSREESAMGAIPTTFNPMAPGVGQNLGAANSMASRIAGLRNNEQDRLQGGTLNTLSIGREIEGSALRDTSAAAGLATNDMLSRYNAKQAVNSGIRQGVAQIGSTAATAAMMGGGAAPIGLQQATPYQYQGGPVMEGAYMTRPNGR
jgi:hypothetical protein